MTLEGSIEAHLATVRRLSKPGGPLAVGAPTETIRNPAWLTGAPRHAARSGRLRLHGELIERAMSDHASAEAERIAYVLAGPPGAGKSTVIDDLLGADHGQFVVVDPDGFQSSLLRQAVEDGSFAEVIKPPEVKELEALGERFFPLEFAALVHEESSRLAHMVHARAAQQGSTW